MGELPEAEMSAFEAEYFADAELFDQLSAAETHLIDDYVRDRLSVDVRARFERTFVTHPARRERVVFAEALAKRVDEEPRAVPSVSTWQAISAWFGGQGQGLRIAGAFAALLIVLTGIWFVINSGPAPADEIVQAPAANEQIVPTDERMERPEVAAPPQPDAQATPPSSRPSPTPVTEAPRRPVSLALSIGAVRGDAAQVPVLVIPAGTTQATLSLTLTENVYSNYRVTLRTLAGREIASRNFAKPKSTRLTLAVPAEKLSPRDYVVTVAGIEDNGTTEDLGRSLFRVKR